MREYYKKNYKVEMVKLAKDNGFDVYTTRSDMNPYYGILACSPDLIEEYNNDKIIMVNERQTLYNNRYIIALALAYYKLEFDPKTMTEYHRIIDILELENDIALYANELLMPSNAFKSCYIKSNRNLYEMQNTFGVTSNLVIDKVKTLSL
jgi:hypothetical protein